jgi:hypothetical protein
MCAASATDLITDTRNAGRPVSTTVATARASGATTLACTALTYWPTASKVHFVTYQIDSNSNPVSGTQLDCEGIVVGNSVTSLVINDGTDNGNSVGDVVEMLPTANWGQDLADALTSQHGRTGTHGAITATSITTTGNAAVGGTFAVTSTSTFTGVATFTAAPVLPVDSVGNADLLTTAGDIGGAWKAWTPTLANWTVGANAVDAKYTQIGKTVHFRLYWKFGAGAAVGTSPTFSLPVTAVTYPGSGGQAQIATGTCLDSTVSPYSLVGMWASTTTALIMHIPATSSVPTTVTASVPGTWSSNDEIYLQGTYEAA